MERAYHEAEFFRAPMARYLATQGIAYWCASTTLWGITVRGIIDRGAVERLIRWVDREHGLSVEPYTSIVDCSLVTGLDEDAFALLVPFAERNRGRHLLEQRDAKIAAVALAAGFSSAAHLSAAFKRRFGVTPSEHRARARA